MRTFLMTLAWLLIGGVIAHSQTTAPKREPAASVALAAGNELENPQTSPLATPAAPQSPDKNHTTLLDSLRKFGITSALGVIFGGLVTFIFNLIFQRRKDRKELKKEADNQFFSGLRAQFALCSQMMWAKHIRVDYLEPARNHPKRYELRDYDAGVNIQSVDLASVSFLLDGITSANLLSATIHAESLFSNLVSLLHHRNQLREEYRQNPSNASLTTVLTTATNDLYNHADSALDALYNQFVALGNELSKRFPTRSNLVLDIEKDW